ncbi:S-adenosyl-L-methionine-dependent methyltransferase [Aspergillus carlsbadensis]|nr:S-adenosyl-L-methionine-dependent methyltransferase [Aspergillus carlsbadensis]
MASTLSDLTSTITSALSSLPPQDKIQDAERMQLLEAINRLQAELEPPPVSMQRICFSHYPLVIIRVAQGMGIFDAFVESKGAQLTLQELSSKIEGDDKLLKRVMRFLCAHRIFKEVAGETYQALPLAMAFGTGSGPGEMIKHFHACLQSSAKIFAYLEERGYKDPEDAYDAPFQLAYNTKDHYFDWLKENPEVQKAFNTVMTISQEFRGEDWFEMFPVAEKLKLNASESSERALLVDIGGGVGHDIKAFRNRFPELAGKLVLQDLPQVIDAIKEPLPGGITAVGHDMFKPQPTKGAKAYYLRTVLHDWPEKQALEALARIREAMAEDSLLLIHEHTTPEGANLPPLAATLDFHMMEMFSASERTEKEWVTLLEKAGFKVAKVWKGQSNTHPVAVFETTL